MLSIVLLSVLLNVGVFSYDETKFLDHSLNNSLNLQLNNSYACDSALISLTSLEKFNLFDASAKIPNGIFSLNLFDLGSFDECLEFKAATLEDVYGKYCLGSVVVDPTKLYSQFNKTLYPKLKEATSTLVFKLGYCLLDVCSTEDFQRILPWATFTDTLCYAKRDKVQFDAVDATAISIFSIIASIVILSTIYDVYLFYQQQQKPWHTLLVAFSLWTNGRKILHTSSNSNQLTCISGIKALSMVWIVYAHVNLYLLYFAVDNIKYMSAFSKSRNNMHLMSATLTVDTFFAVGGLLLTYTFLKSQKLKTFNVGMFYFHRYLRLTPPFAAVVFFHASIFKYIGSGPLWGSVYALQQPCRDYWWSSLLYIQNFINVNNMCTGQSWYLNADMQIYLFTPIILVPLVKWPKYALGALLGLAVAGVVVPFGISYGLDLQSSLAAEDRDNMNDYMDYYYLQAYARFGPYVIGMIFGYFIYLVKHRDEKTIKWNRPLVIFSWLVALGGLLACSYGNGEMFTGLTTDVWSKSFHNGLNRNAWALAICIIVMLCSLGYGGPINAFLSLPLFQIVAKLSYSIYLLHITVIESRLMNNKIIEHFSEMSVISTFWGDFMNTLIISFFLSTIFESPIIVIEKVLFGKSKKKEVDGDTIKA